MLEELEFPKFNKEEKDVTPPELRLECYTFTIRKRRARRDDIDAFVDFDSIMEGEFPNSTTGLQERRRMDFQEFFSAFIGSFENKFVVYKGSGKAINLKSETVRFNSRERTISGTVEGGTTNMGGFVKEQSDIDSEFILTPNHVSGQPYYFLLYMPEASNLGILIFQSYSVASFSDIFRRQLQSFVNIGNEHIMKFDTYISEEIVNDFREKGRIEKVSIFQQAITPDRGGSIFEAEFKPESKFNMELRITGADAMGTLSDRLMDFLTSNNKKSNFFSMEELGNIGFTDESEIKFTFEHGGKKNTITSRNNFQFSPNYYLEAGAVERDSNFLPVFDAIDVFCRDYLSYLLKKLNKK